tara:strand:- start:221 stop:526 length:306 start_codon:yes stop_codon:yes gene_type:complete
MANRLKYMRIRKDSKGKRFYKNIKYPNIPLTSNDIYVITTIGDRLDSIAFQFYNDVRLWWVIATANPQVIRRDSYNLKPNLEIRIPANVSSIIEKFEQLNQ